ncbi:MAG: hypothetical protein N3D84_00825 [Candidatus Woesearchaeota archaeon]|nr:hypothetical protein [Candidatus Woesearchaeota archaeon]
MAKRAQAAMEFLMTYGWAILVVLVVIGALAYFGVLSPQKLLPDKCTATTGFTCTDKTADTSAIKIKLLNGIGETVTVTDASFTSPGKSSCIASVTKPDGASGINAPWVAGTEMTFSAGGNTCTFASGEKARGTFDITYYTTDVNFKKKISADVAITVR